MSNKYIGAKHLSSKAVGDLQRGNNFFVQIVGLAVDVCMMIKGLAIPSVENEVITVKFGNSQIKLPGSASVSDTELTFYDSIDLDTEAELSKWRDQVFNFKTHKIGKASDIKKIMYITEYTPDGDTGRQWVAEGVWASSFKPGDLASDGSDLKTMSLTVQCDTIVRVYGKV